MTHPTIEDRDKLARDLKAFLSPLAGEATACGEGVPNDHSLYINLGKLRKARALYNRLTALTYPRELADGERCDLIWRLRTLYLALVKEGNYDVSSLGMAIWLLETPAHPREEIGEASEADVEWLNMLLETANAIRVEPAGEAWVVIDTNSAEPEVNWPGEAIGQPCSWEEAKAICRQARAKVLASRLASPSSPPEDANALADGGFHAGQAVADRLHRFGVPQADIPGLITYLDGYYREHAIASSLNRVSIADETLVPFRSWLHHIEATGSRRLADDEYVCISGAPKMGELRKLVALSSTPTPTGEYVYFDSAARQLKRVTPTPIDGEDGL